MKTVPLRLGEDSYTVLVGYPLPRLGEAMASAGLSGRAVVITNPKVHRLYGDMVLDSLRRSDFEAHSLVVPDGEEHKSLDTANSLYQRLMEAGLERQQPIVALGGGVITDLAGFVAATYKRGVPLVMVPTTLLAQVDSSIGGKVAVNHPGAKNIVGAFHQPKLVYIDITVLRSLPEREFRCGLAEVIKHAFIGDRRFFAQLERDLRKIQEGDLEKREFMVWRACQIKRWVVERDVKETRGVREWLNFGHTVGHALEAALEYRGLRHGEAISVGMVAAARIARGRGLLQESWARRLERLLERAGLPTRLPDRFSDEKMETVLEAMGHDKKILNGRLRFVLPERAGRVRIYDDVTEEEVRRTLDGMRN